VDFRSHFEHVVFKHTLLFVQILLLGSLPTNGQKSSGNSPHNPNSKNNKQSKSKTITTVPSFKRSKKSFRSLYSTKDMSVMKRRMSGIEISGLAPHREAPIIWGTPSTGDLLWGKVDQREEHHMNARLSRSNIDPVSPKPRSRRHYRTRETFCGTTPIQQKNPI
jgi:hypothetical protein